MDKQAMRDLLDSLTPGEIRSLSAMINGRKSKRFISPEQQMELQAGRVLARASRLADK